MTLAKVNSALACHALQDFGAFHPSTDDALPGVGTLIMIGPKEPGFWPHFTTQPEYLDGQPDPMNRWSTRVLTEVAQDLTAQNLQTQAMFPFGGPPYQPFIAWAQRTGQTWQSPAGLLVNAQAGLMISYRGALAVSERLPLPAPPPCPCNACPDKPCLNTCPVNALTGTSYDIPACHAYLDTPAERGCLIQGCAARLACPVSQTYERLPAQSAFHMKAFHR